MKYTLRVSKRVRYMRLSVTGEGLVVVIPQGVPRGVLDNFLLKREGWIKEKLSYVGKFPWLFGSRSKAESKKEFERYKEEARALVTKRVGDFNIHYNFSYKKISIKNTKTRWGSCSRTGNLSFSYKLVFLPPHLADYVVVHELCHLGEFNHSSKFWKLVSQSIPNYNLLRKELRGQMS